MHARYHIWHAYVYTCLNDPRVSGLTLLPRRTPLTSLLKLVAASLHLFKQFVYAEACKTNLSPV